MSADARAGAERVRAARRRGLAVWAASGAAHLAILAALLTAHGTPPRTVEAEPMTVQLAQAPPPAEPLSPPTPAPPAPAKPPPPRHVARPARAPPPDVRPLPSGKGPSADGDAEVSDSQLASAATPGSGPPGRCDMARQLQAALRRNALVQTAVAEAHAPGKAMFVWNGDWVRSQGQDGAGLAAVREAIMWEIAFAPEACRTEPVHGLVLLSLNDGPGAGRLVMGAGAWRWSDLLRRR